MNCQETSPFRPVVAGREGELTAIEALRSKLRRIFDPLEELTIPFLLAYPAASHGECPRGRIQDRACTGGKAR